MSQIDSRGTAYEIQGADDRPVLALIHGLGLTRETWNGHLPALSQEYRVLTYDLYGHGESAAPPSAPSLTLFSEQLCDLMDELSIDQAALIGFSLGGMINRRLAIDHPDRVSALLVSNSPHDRGQEAQRLVEQQAVEAGDGGPGATLDAAIERWFTAGFRETHGDVITEVRNCILANDPVNYAQSRWVLAHGVKELIRPDPPIHVPALVMTCENDTGSTPKMSQDIAVEIEGAELKIVPLLRHMGLVEQPDLFTSPILDFLDRHYADLS